MRAIHHRLVGAGAAAAAVALGLANMVWRGPPQPSPRAPDRLSHDGRPGRPAAPVAGTGMAPGPAPSASAPTGDTAQGPDAPSRRRVVFGAESGAVARATQLPYAMADLVFLGWSDESRRFVLEGQHRDDAVPAASIRLRQVHDTLTGLMVESFQLDLVGDALAAPTLSTAWQEAVPSRGATNHPDPIEPALAHEGWTLEAHVEGGVPTGTEFNVSTVGEEIRYAWTQLPTAPARPGASSLRGPKVIVTLQRRRTTWAILELGPISYAYDEVSDLTSSAPPAFEGTVRAFWAPDHRRVVLVTRSGLVGVAPPADAITQRYFVRAIGPQIRVVDAGAGGIRANAVAIDLDAAGLAVTNVGAQPEPVAGTAVYYRGDPAVAMAVAKQVGGAARLVKLKKAGWYHIIVALGDPRLPAAGATIVGDD